MEDHGPPFNFIQMHGRCVFHWVELEEEKTRRFTSTPFRFCEGIGSLCRRRRVLCVCVAGDGPRLLLDEPSTTRTRKNSFFFHEFVAMIAT